MGYQADLLVRTNGGSLWTAGTEIHVRMANAVTLILSAATSYLDKYPAYTGNHYRAFNRDVLEKTSGKTYALLLADNDRDYRRLFGRVSLNLKQRKRLSSETTRVSAASPLATVQGPP